MKMKAVIFITSLSIPWSAFAGSWRDLNDAREYPSFVAIENYNDAGRGSGCTGIFIAAELVLTAGHCAAAYSRFLIKAPRLNMLEEKSPFRLRDCDDRKVPSVADWDGFLIPIEKGASLDYQILKAKWMDGKARLSVTPARLSTTYRFLRQTKVDVIGYPVDRDGRLTISSGEVAQFPYVWQNNPSQNFVAYTAPQGPQMSGGPIFDSLTKELIAITHGSTRSPEGLDSSDLNQKSYGTVLADIASVSLILQKIIRNDVDIDFTPLFAPSKLWLDNVNGEMGENADLRLICPGSEK